MRARGRGPLLKGYLRIIVLSIDKNRRDRRKHMFSILVDIATIFVDLALITIIVRRWKD
nr:MAG TPA: hypothetical protein [Caudoviricetes sp.]